MASSVRKRTLVAYDWAMRIFDICALVAAPQHGCQFLVYRQNIAGFNAVFSTKPGYNLMLGNGTPMVQDSVRGGMNHRPRIRKRMQSSKHRAGGIEEFTIWKWASSFGVIIRHRGKSRPG
jgi:hypothetical protein